MSLCLLLTLLQALPAGAAELLLPQGCLPADAGPDVSLHFYVPEDRHCRGQVRARAAVGHITETRCVGPSLFELRYRPGRASGGTRETLRATWSDGGRGITSEIQADVCPYPAGEVRLRAEPKQLLAGQGQRAVLNIAVTDSSGRPWEGAPPRLTCNVGRIEMLRRVGAGAYQAVFLPPEDPFPQVAIIMAANPAGARLDRIAVGRVVIPITAQVTLPGQTRPGTRMIMRVAGRKFGPVRADSRGRFELPILVPPGVNTGMATSIDGAGNRRTREVNLYLPETNQLGLWAYPLHLPADGKSRSRLLVTTVSARGVPLDLGRISIKSRHGRVAGLRRVARGLLEAYYTAPERRGALGDTIRVEFPGGGSKSHAQVTVKLLPGRAASIKVSTPPSLVAGAADGDEVVVDVSDDRGNPVPGRKLLFSSRLVEFGQVSEPAPGRYRVPVRVPAAIRQWRDELQVEVTDYPEQEPSRLVIAPSSLEAGATSSPRLIVCLVGERGRPVARWRIQRLQPEPVVERTTDRFGCAGFAVTVKTLQNFRPQAWLLGWAGSRQRRRVFLVRESERVRLLPVALDEQLPAREPLRKKVSLLLRPPVEIELLLSAQRQGNGWLVRVQARTSRGDPAPQARIALHTSQGRLEALGMTATGEWSWRLDPGQAGWERLQLVATETGSGSAAVMLLKEGSN